MLINRAKLKIHGETVEYPAVVINSDPDASSFAHISTPWAMTACLMQRALSCRPMDPAVFSVLSRTVKETILSTLLRICV